MDIPVTSRKITAELCSVDNIFQETLFPSFILNIRSFLILGQD
jgi:hypothetical protein